MLNQAKQLQKQLFFQITQRLNRNGQKIEQLGTTLNIRKTALYNRINGDKLLNLEEILILSEQFGIDINQFLKGKEEAKTFNLTFPFLRQPVSSEREYVLGLLRNLKHIQTLEDYKIHYVTSEVPILFYFRFYELGLFKIFVYSKAVWEIPTSRYQFFNFDFLKEQNLAPTFEKTYQAYLDIPSYEIWSTHLIENTLSQIQYYAESGVFSRIEDAILLCQQLKTLFWELMSYAEVGKKDGQGVFHLYHNETMHTNNTVLASGKHTKMVFSTYDNPNYCISDNPELWDYTFSWYERLKKQASLISGGAEKNRLRLFNHCFYRIEQTEKFLKGISK